MSARLHLFEGVTAEIVHKAMAAFDRVILVMVSVAWAAALAFSGLALYTSHLASKAKAQVEEAVAAKPALPVIQKKSLDRSGLEVYATKLSKRYNGINFSASQDSTLTVSAPDPDNFSNWLNSLGYLDTLTPDVTWEIKDICVGGECSAGGMMRITLQASRVTFAAPKTSKQD